MIKIKNTNNYDSIIMCNGVEIVIQPQTIMEVNEIVLGSLPEGVVQYKDVQLLTEIDPYIDLLYTNVDTKQMLTEE